MYGIVMLAATAALQFSFGERATGTPSAAEVELRYRSPAGEQAKPSPIRMVALRLPPGTGLPLATFPACAASDEELQLLGTAACPPESRFGDGSLTVATGFGPPVDPFATDVTLFNTRDGVLELVTEPLTGATLAIERLRLEDGWLVGHPAVPPGGPPDLASAVRDIHWTVPRGYLTTPAECPASGEWITLGRFRFEDGSEAAASSTTPCEVAPRRLTVRPARVAAGRVTTVRVRLPTTARCRAGATVTVAGATARTDAGGRARLRLRLPAGEHRVEARRTGCVPRAGRLVAG